MHRSDISGGRERLHWCKYVVLIGYWTHHPVHPPAGEDVTGVDEAVQHFCRAFHHLLQKRTAGRGPSQESSGMPQNTTYLTPAMDSTIDKIKRPPALIHKHQRDKRRSTYYTG